MHKFKGLTTNILLAKMVHTKQLVGLEDPEGHLSLKPLAGKAGFRK
jgi:hypothetical protein